GGGHRTLLKKGGVGVGWGRGGDRARSLAPEGLPREHRQRGQLLLPCPRARPDRPDDPGGGNRLVRRARPAPAPAAHEPSPRPRRMEAPRCLRLDGALRPQRPARAGRTRPRRAVRLRRRAPRQRRRLRGRRDLPGRVRAARPRTPGPRLRRRRRPLAWQRAAPLRPGRADGRAGADEDRAARRVPTAARPRLRPAAARPRRPDRPRGQGRALRVPRALLRSRAAEPERPKTAQPPTTLAGRVGIKTITLQIRRFAQATELVHRTRPLRPPTTQAGYMRSIIACAKAEVEISCAPSISRARS